MAGVCKFFVGVMEKCNLQFNQKRERGKESEREGEESSGGLCEFPSPRSVDISLGKDGALRVHFTP